MRLERNEIRIDEELMVNGMVGLRARPLSIREGGRGCMYVFYSSIVYILPLGTIEAG